MKPSITLLSLGLALSLAACTTAPSDAPMDGAAALAGSSIFDGGSVQGLQLAEQLAWQRLQADPTLLQGISELKVDRSQVDSLGMAHVRYQQTLGGVPVWGAQAIVHLARDGRLFRVTDDTIRGLQVDTQPAYTADEAIDLALAAHGPRADLSQAPAADLWVLRTKAGAYLAWRVQIRDIEDATVPSIPVIFIDAHTGDVISSYDNLQTYALSDADKVTYDLRHRTSYRRAVVGDSSDGDLLTTQTSVGSALGFLATQGRDSFNGSGAVVKSYGHYSTSYVNAFWDGSELNFGDGDGYYSNYLGVLDVSAHELGHGVTQYEANLTYSNESGALNEGASDILAASVEAWVDGAVTTDTWDIGEDCWIEPGTTALRYMDRPSDDGSSKDYYPARYTGTSDNGGVHSNSGIANHFFYLLSEGGQHHTAAYRSGTTVPGLGIDAAYDIWYLALSSYMSSSTNFAGARTATESACTALGYSATQCDSVSYAWYEVGVGSSPAPSTGGGDTGTPPGDTGTPPGDTGTADTGTGGGGPACAGTLYTGSLSGAGDYAIEPGGTYAHYSSITATLSGPVGTDFDLYLVKSSHGRWKTVASSTGTTSDEVVSSGSSGDYYVQVQSYSGAGTYNLCIE